MLTMNYRNEANEDCVRCSYYRSMGIGFSGWIKPQLIGVLIVSSFSRKRGLNSQAPYAIQLLSVVLCLLPETWKKTSTRQCEIEVCSLMWAIGNGWTH